MLPIDTTTFVSPNHSSRGTTPIDLLVLHATVGDAISSLRHLCNPAPTNPVTKKPDPNLAVSITYLINKLGKVYQLVDESRAAWHAGASRWRGRTSAAIRDGSIGIELENRNDGKDPYPTAQMTALILLTRDIQARRPIPTDHIVSHAEVAIPSGRKTDPKGFDWAAYRAALSVQPAVRRYKVRGLPVYESSSRSGPQWGCLQQGDIIEIDDASNGHIASLNGKPAPIGFIRFDPDTLEAV